ncbi:hypothetical protein [Glutamicibacter mysorens]|uniref:hypothetical protein n=1 Tax=Glutamicibacter mysorens TaxID=257984 RepID=UPI0020C6A461|nr:hypothetical protein [Glutamicibacter mysorens]UTM45968.1 hypothetical protein XH9_10345 [Glutamicibacter mysorens]
MYLDTGALDFEMNSGGLSTCATCRGSPRRATALTPHWASQDNLPRGPLDADTAIIVRVDGFKEGRQIVADIQALIDHREVPPHE